MPVLSECPGCKKQLHIPDDAVGKNVRCPGCRLVYVAEAPAAAAPRPDDGAERLDRHVTPITEGLPPTIVPEETAATGPRVSTAAPRHAPMSPGRSAARKQGGAAPILFVVLGALFVTGICSLVCIGGVGWLYLGANARAPQAIAPNPRLADNVEVGKELAIQPPAADLPWQKNFKEKIVQPENGGPKEKFPAKEKFGPPENFPPPWQFQPPPDLGPKEKFLVKEKFGPKDKFGPVDPRPKGPVAPKGDVVTRTLPAPIGNVVIGGGGRLLILHLPRLRQVAVFDVQAAKVVKYLPLADDNVLIAAGMTKLVVAFPTTKVVQRWDMATWKCERTATLPGSDVLAGIGMGYAVDGPLAVQTVRAPHGGASFFIDVGTMRRTALPVKQLGFVQYRVDAAMQMRASPDGRCFGISAGGFNGHLLTIESDGAVLRECANHRPMFPGPDGKTLFGLGLFRTDMTRLASSPPHDTVCVPAIAGPFYLAIPAGTYHPQVPGQRKIDGIELRMLGDQRPLLSLPDIENAMRDITSIANLKRGGLTIDQRYHLFPAAQLLVTIPDTADRLELRKLNVDDALERSGIDYLFTASTPVRYAVRGQKYVYPVQVRSKTGGLKYSLDAGPEGMGVAASGTVTWTVPGNFAADHADVIMTIGARGGQEMFHTFRVAVVKELPADAPPPIAVAERKEDKEPKNEPDVPAPPPGPDALAIRPPPLDAAPLTCNLPAVFDELVVGGGGRFLLLNLPSQRKIALFDVNEAKFVHYFPVGGDNVKYAASLDKLVMVFPDTQIIQRWDLVTRKREQTATLAMKGTITNVLIGSASRGPVVIATVEKYDRGETVLLEQSTLKPRGAVRPITPGHLSPANLARISADGTVIGCWGQTTSPSGLQVHHVTSGGLKGFYEHESVGHVIPSADGKSICTSRGLFTNELKPTAGNVLRGAGPWSVPAVHGQYYLSIEINRLGPMPEERVVSVHLQGEQRTLLKLPNIPVPREINGWAREKFGNDKRLLLIPAAKMIVTVPEGNDRLIVHRFDVEEAMDQAGIDYLYTTSRAPGTAVKGTNFVYPIATRSKKGGLTYKLDSGPEGMRVSPAGVIAWNVPADHAGGDADVIVTIADQSGQEVFHTFRISVVDAQPAGTKDEVKN